MLVFVVLVFFLILFIGWVMIRRLCFGLVFCFFCGEWLWRSSLLLEYWRVVVLWISLDCLWFRRLWLGLGFWWWFLLVGWSVLLGGRVWLIVWWWLVLVWLVIGRGLCCWVYGGIRWLLLDRLGFWLVGLILLLGWRIRRICWGWGLGLLL